MAGAVRSGDPNNLEATAAALYFPSLFGAGFSRGEECRINAALNYGYAITAVGRLVQSFSRVLQEGGALDLPELLPHLQRNGFRCGA